MAGRHQGKSFQQLAAEKNLEYQKRGMACRAYHFLARNTFGSSTLQSAIKEREHRSQQGDHSARQDLDDLNIIASTVKHQLAPTRGAIRAADNWRVAGGTAKNVGRAAKFTKRGATVATVANPAAASVAVVAQVTEVASNAASSGAYLGESHQHQVASENAQKREATAVSPHVKLFQSSLARAQQLESNMALVKAGKMGRKAFLGLADLDGFDDLAEVVDSDAGEKADRWTKDQLNRYGNRLKGAHRVALADEKRAMVDLASKNIATSAQAAQRHKDFTANLQGDLDKVFHKRKFASALEQLPGKVQERADRLAHKNAFAPVMEELREKKQAVSTIESAFKKYRGRKFANAFMQAGRAVNQERKAISEATEVFEKNSGAKTWGAKFADRNKKPSLHTQTLAHLREANMAGSREERLHHMGLAHESAQKWIDKRDGGGLFSKTLSGITESSRHKEMRSLVSKLSGIAHQTPVKLSESAPRPSPAK